MPAKRSQTGEVRVQLRWNDINAIYLCCVFEIDLLQFKNKFAKVKYFTLIIKQSTKRGTLQKYSH